MIRAQLALVAGALTLACLATPWVYGAAGLVGSEPPWPFSRVFDRVALLCALVLGVLLRRRLGLDRLHRCVAAEGWPARVRAGGFGLCVAALTALATFPWLVAGPAVSWSHMAPGRLLLKLAGALGGALLASVLEEGFFRVLVFGALRRRYPVLASAALASVFYALLHFLSPVREFRYAPGAPLQGFDYFARVLSRFGEPAILPGLLGLFLVGGVLCLTIQRSGSFSLCVGLHAGWFLAAKAAVYAITVQPGLLEGGLAKRYFLVGRPSTWLSVLCAGGLVWIASGRFRTAEAAPREARARRRRA